MKKLQDIYYRYRGFARHPCCMVGTIDYFSYGKKSLFYANYFDWSCHATWTWLPCKNSIETCMVRLFRNTERKICNQQQDGLEQSRILNFGTKVCHISTNLSVWCKLIVFTLYQYSFFHLAIFFAFLSCLGIQN